jgi:hypothetical protein
MNEIPLVKNTGLIKSVNVEYSENQERLSLYVPLENGDYSIGGGMEAPMWNKYTWIEGSAPFLCSEPALPIRFKLFRTVNHLFICFFMEDCGGRVQSKDTADGVVGVWSGDMAEIHFGDISPDAAWHRQLAIGIAGNRFDSCALYDAWEARSFQTGNGWGAEVKIDLANLPCSEGGFRFNLCRMSLEGRNGRYATWSRVRGGFHNIADYGELLFIDYDQTLMLRFSENRPGISRLEYQRLAAELGTPAHAITHGPYLTNPQQGKMTISWTSAGRVRARFPSSSRSRPVKATSSTRSSNTTMPRETSSPTSRRATTFSSTAGTPHERSCGSRCRRRGRHQRYVPREPPLLSRCTYR